MKISKLARNSILALVSATTPFLVSAANPHFFVQMENLSSQQTSVSFRALTPNVSLIPELADHSLLPPNQLTARFGVMFTPLGKDDNFNIIFTGKQDCLFNVAFYAVNNPKITISGPGCFGGGYEIIGNTLRLFVSDIHWNSVQY